MSSLLAASLYALGLAHAAPVVYGYLPYWQDPETDVPWDHLTHVGLFAAEVDASGRLTSTSSWRSRAPDVLSEAEGRGIQVNWSWRSLMRTGRERRWARPLPGPPWRMRWSPNSWRSAPMP